KVVAAIERTVKGAVGVDTSQHDKGCRTAHWAGFIRKTRHHNLMVGLNDDRRQRIEAHEATGIKYEFAGAIEACIEAAVRIVFHNHGVGRSRAAHLTRRCASHRDYSVVRVNGKIVKIVGGANISSHLASHTGAE